MSVYSHLFGNAKSETNNGDIGNAWMQKNLFADRQNDIRDFDDNGSVSEFKMSRSVKSTRSTHSLDHE